MKEFHLNKYLSIFLLIFICAFSFYYRIDEVFIYLKKPELKKIFFVKDQPLIVNVDGYLYLRYAKELLNGTYYNSNRVDRLRIWPNTVKKPIIPPMISTSAAYLTIFTHSLFWSAVLLSAIIATSLVLFFYIFSKKFLNNELFAIFSSALLSFGHYFFLRSVYGWYDTDAGNVFFISALTLLAYGYLFLKDKKSEFKVLFVYCALSLLFIFWYDQIRFFALSVSVILISIALLLKKQYKLFISFLTIGMLFLAVVFGFDKTIHSFKNLLGYILKIEKPTIWPDISYSISEQKVLTFNQMVKSGYGSFIAFILTVLGLIWFIIKEKEKILIFSPLILLSIFSIKSIRLCIYSAPIMAFFSAYFLVQLIQSTEVKKYINIDQKYRYGLSIILFLICFISIFWPLRKTALAIRISPVEAKTMAMIYQYTPKDSLIFSWWDRGYQIQFFGERTTYFDGQYHDSKLTWADSFPFVTDSERAARNFIIFYSKWGRQGLIKAAHIFKDPKKSLDFLKEIMKLDEEDAKNFLRKNNLDLKLYDFYFPKINRPIYLYIPKNLSKIQEWLYYFYNYNPNTHETKIEVYSFCPKTNNLNNRCIIFDRVHGLAKVKRLGIVPIKKILIYSKNQLVDEKYYNQNAKVLLLYNKDKDYAAIVTKRAFNSVYNKLWFLKQYDSRYFQPVYLLDPIAQLWKVVPRY